MTDYLDLTGEITAEQHRKVYESLMGQFETWRRSNRWCVELYTHYISRLSPVFRWEYASLRDLGTPAHRGGHGGADIVVWLDFDSAGDDLARDLRDLRGRILRFTLDQPDHIDLDKANQFLTNAGLEPWSPEPEPEGPKRYSVSFYCSATTELSQADIEARLHRLAGRIGAPSYTVSMGVSEDRPRRTTYIPESQTVRLLTR